MATEEREVHGEKVNFDAHLGGAVLQIDPLENKDVARNEALARGEIEPTNAAPVNSEDAKTNTAKSK